MGAAQSIIVSAANDLYLPLILNLLRSLRRHSYPAAFDIGILDVGLGDEARAQIAAFGAQLAPARADIDYPGRAAWEKEMPAFRAMTARPFLPSYFPGYEACMWIDADAWAQTPDAIATMLQGALAAKNGELFIASEIDRDYRPYFLSSQPFQYHFDWFKANFPAETVAAIFPRPMLNSGVFALSAASPVWKIWAETFAACLARIPQMTRAQFMADQLSLNVAVYMNGLPLAVMPAEYNWLSLYATPMFDEAQNLFVRPTAPRTPISILHLTHKQKLRALDIATVSGGTITRTLLDS